jgi:hypothetical protein
MPRPPRPPPPSPSPHCTAARDLLRLRMLQLAGVALLGLGAPHGEANASLPAGTPASLSGVFEAGSTPIHGRIETAETTTIYPDDDPVVVTYFSIRLLDVIGTTLRPDQAITLVVPGGQIGETTYGVVGAPRLRVGDEVLATVVPVRSGSRTNVWRLPDWRLGILTEVDGRALVGGRAFLADLPCHTVPTFLTAESGPLPDEQYEGARDPGPNEPLPESRPALHVNAMRWADAVRAWRQCASTTSDAWSTP